MVVDGVDLAGETVRGDGFDSDALADVMKRCLEADPAARPTLTALDDALQALQEY